MSPLHAATIAETFDSDPFAKGWRIHGEAALFAWNSANESLEVTWDSSRTNSYFCLPLNNILSKHDDFTVAFDIRLRDIAIGTSSNKQYTFQIAVGLFRFANATATNFFRGAGQSVSGPRNMVEFAYFPDSGYGATFAPTVVTSNNLIIFNSNNHPLEITPGDLYHVRLSFTSSNRTLRTEVTRNGVPFGMPPSDRIYDTVLSATHDFRVDTVAVMSYSDAIQIGPREWWGSVLAHGSIDNLSVTLPDPPLNRLAGTFSNGVWQTAFSTRTNWAYVLERSVDLVSWKAASGTLVGTGSAIVLADTNAPEGGSYYRLRAERP